MAASHSAALTGRGAASDQNGECYITAPADRMLNALAELRTGLDAPLELRIGLASGPVVGGVIGKRRTPFDLWGDTVNIASRMETSGVPGRIHVAPSTRDLLLSSHSFEEREPLEVKGLGRMTSYLLADPAPSEPRHRFTAD